MAVIKHREQRVGIFIDTQNMYHSARDLFGARVNFGKMVEEVVGERRLVRAVAYVIRTSTGDEKPFFDALTHAGIETREKDLQVFLGGGKKADWDVGLAVDAIRIAPLLDVVVLVSGDGDFAPLVEYLKYQGCQVEVAAFRGTTATKLVEVADSFTDLSEFADNILIGSRAMPREEAPTRITPPARSRKTTLTDRQPITDF